MQPQSGHVPVAETSRLILRRLAESDLEFMADLFGSLEVMRYSLTGPLARAQAAEILAGLIRSYDVQPLGQWGIVFKPAGQLIGLCGFLQRIDSPAGEWELAYRLLPDFWNRGLATEAALACRDLASGTPGVIEISALIEAPNQASIRVAEKVGMQFTGETWLDSIPVQKFAVNLAAGT